MCMTKCLLGKDVNDRFFERNCSFCKSNWLFSPSSPAPQLSLFSPLSLIFVLKKWNIRQHLPLIEFQSWLHPLAAVVALAGVHEVPEWKVLCKSELQAVHKQEPLLRALNTPALQCCWDFTLSGYSLHLHTLSVTFVAVVCITEHLPFLLVPFVLISSCLFSSKTGLRLIIQ